ncbi:hypothetical protein H4217_002012 [Coemansia sp. RSA 1939]|nr:hypothetical protein H4217_002012 [Coemansia sp. RSA 1939]KAJ2600614.1 hypothetical protein EV177_007112 [Coemansia sp. RSA 1804]
MAHRHHHHHHHASFNDIDTRPPHPYCPPTLELPGYAEPAHRTSALVLTMGASITVLILAASRLYWTRHTNAVSGGGGIPLPDRLAALWFVVCGALHTVFELYYIVHSATLAQERTLVADLWKEYALSDSRYVAATPMVRALESVTVLVTGPLCWTVAYATWSGKTHLHPVRHLAQLSASLLHLYSVSIYYGTELVGSAVSNCRPEHIYYYGYFVAMNLPWLLVPLVLGVASFREIYKSMALVQEKEEALRL